MKSRKNILIVSTLLAVIFIAAQFAFNRTSEVGLCSPYLGAPAELGHPAVQRVYRGFPFPFVTIAIDKCFDGPNLYEWSPIGIGFDVFVLALIAYPFWKPLMGRHIKTTQP